MGVYFILLEEATGIRPLYGVIVTGNGQREIVRNTDELRAWVLRIAERLRARRGHLVEIIQVSQPAANCRGCGVRKACGQRSDRQCFGTMKRLNSESKNSAGTLDPSRSS